MIRIWRINCFLALIFCCSIASAQQPKAKYTLKDTERMNWDDYPFHPNLEDFSFTSWQAEKIEAKEHLGKVVIIASVAFLYKNNERDVKQLLRWQERYANQGLVILAYDSGGNGRKQELDTNLAMWKVTFPVYRFRYMRPGSTPFGWKTNQPGVHILDRQGKLCFQGFIRDSTANMTLLKLFSEK